MRSDEHAGAVIHQEIGAAADRGGHHRQIRSELRTIS
jgi:hypothetical protein